MSHEETRADTRSVPTILDIDDVAVSLGGVRVLDGVTASADEGRFVGLVGPNGAGKTTLLRTVNGSLTPDRGAVRVAGDSIADLSAKAVGQRVATVPQNTSLAFDFSVRQTVEMGRTPYLSRFGGMRPEDHEAVERAMERTAVTEFADRSITEVSGGERQRVLLARALAQDTPLLLLDEPTASLDINHQVRTLELVRDLVDDGKTVVAAIHDLNLAAHYCDELLLLGDGTVLASGPPASVLTEGTLERAFGANAVVSQHPVTGSVYVTALPDRRTDGEAEGHVHVVGGGGSAARYLYLLSAAGYQVSVGALNEGDSDTETARQLGLDVVTVDPFAPIDAAARQTVIESVEQADATLVVDVEVGDGNLANLEAARAADELVLVETRPFAERNYAGDAAARIYEGLRTHATVATPDEVLGRVTEAVERKRSQSLSPETDD